MHYVIPMAREDGIEVRQDSNIIHEDGVIAIAREVRRDFTGTM